MTGTNSGKNAVARVEALAAYAIMDTAAEDGFDQLAKVAASICGAPVAAVSLLDEDRQWLKSRIGLKSAETPIEFSFCAHAMQRPDEVMVVTDAREDERFRENPLVTGEPYIRFYAGAPILTPGGVPIGAVCAIDRKVRELTPLQEETLRCLANWATVLLEQRRIAAGGIPVPVGAPSGGLPSCVCPTCGSLLGAGAARVGLPR